MEVVENMTVNLKGIELTARYRYNSGQQGSWDSEPLQPYVELLKVFAGEVNIIDLLSAEDEEVIENQIYSSKN